MEFLHEPLNVSLSESPGCTESRYFAADIFFGRPTPDEIDAFKDVAIQMTEGAARALSRSKAIADWLAVIIDEEGALMLLRTKKRVALSHMKACARVIFDLVLDTLPESQREVARSSFRPLDELDSERVAAWKTVHSIRPKKQYGERKRDEEEEEEVTYTFVPGTGGMRKEQPATPMVVEPLSLSDSLAQFLATHNYDSETDDDVPAPCLMLADAPSSAPLAMRPINSPEDVDIWNPASVWEYRAKTEATIVVVEAGGRPPQLEFVHCHREDRRQLFLQKHVQEKYDKPRLPHVVRILRKLCARGAIPFEDNRPKKVLARCAAALKAIDSEAVTDPKDLPPADKVALRQALGDQKFVEPFCQNTFSCLNWPPGQSHEKQWKHGGWIDTEAGPICAICSTPRSYWSRREWTHRHEYYNARPMHRAMYGDDPEPPYIADYVPSFRIWKKCGELLAILNLPNDDPGVPPPPDKCARLV